MNAGNQKQIEKYGGEEGYRAEMRRRRALRKDYSTSGFAGMKKKGRLDEVVDAAKKSAQKRRGEA